MMVSSSKEEVVEAAWQGFSGSETRIAEVCAQIAGPGFTQHDSEVIAAAWQLGFYSALCAWEAGNMRQVTIANQNVRNN